MGTALKDAFVMNLQYAETDKRAGELRFQILSRAETCTAILISSVVHQSVLL